VGNLLLQLRPYSPYLLMTLIFFLPRIGLDVVGFLIGVVKEPLMLLLFSL